MNQFPSSKQTEAKKRKIIRGKIFKFTNLHEPHTILRNQQSHLQILTVNYSARYTTVLRYLDSHSRYTSI